MKKTKLLLTASLLSIGAFSTTIMTSCSKDNKTCNVGYEGSDCKTLSRDKFLNTWIASDKQLPNGPDLTTYNAIVSGNSSSITTINIGGFSNSYFVNNVIADVSGNTFTIENQQPDNDGYSVSGSGTINTNDNSIVVKYTITEVSSNAVIEYSGTWK